MKNSCSKLIVAFCLVFGALFSNEVKAAGPTNYPLLSPSVTLANPTGCALTSYTFTQTTANNNDAKIIIGASVTITFPAGVNITTATCAGSSFGGVGINCATWNILAQTITFTSPAAIGKNVSFDIVINNVTNPASMAGSNATVSIINNSLGTNSATNYAITTTICPVVPPNDNCNGTNGTPVVLAVPASGFPCATPINGTTFGATASSQPSCGGIPDDDVWYSLTATNTFHQITVTGVAGFNAHVQVFSGTCALPVSLNCTNATGDGGTEQVDLSGLVIGATYLVRVYHTSTGSGFLGSNSFSICVGSVTPTVCTGFLPSDLTAASLPYSSGAQTTCGATNNITSSTSTVCGSPNYYSGEDKIIKFTPSSSGSVAINLTSTGSYTGIMLYQGCPTSGGTCVANAQSFAGNKSIGCAPVSAGQTYYLVVDSWASPCNPFSVTISAPTVGDPLGTTCANSQPITLPYTATGQSTLCYGNDYTNSTAGVGTTSFMSGEDKVYSFTANAGECIGITITNSSYTYIGWHVFSGCPGSGGTLVGRAEGSSGGGVAGSVTVPTTGTYYLIVDNWATPNFVNYDLNVISLGASPANDVCSGATPVTLGSSVAGDNNCTGSESPAAPACWQAYNMNTVWYTAVAPASGKLKIKITGSSLTNPQMAVYSGTCASLTLVAGACNDDAPSCGGSMSNDSELNLTGLTSGATYWIRVDGYGNATGTFSVFVDDGNSLNNTVLIPGQDCGDPNPVCSALISVSNPGYSGSGNVCDLPTTYCLGSGERHVAWYRVAIGGAGTFGFNIVPNDFVQSSSSATDYDFGLWKIASGDPSDVLGTNYFNCDQIAAGSAPPVACNFNPLGVTGVAGPGGEGPGAGGLGTACPQCTSTYNPNSTFDAAYNPLVNALAGDVFLIAVSNYSASSSGFRMNFQGTATITYETASNIATTGITWSGGDVSTPTVWTDVDNWGGCVAPSCAIDTYIQVFASQPILTNGNVYTTDDITIGPGATLTLQAGSTLEVCGNFTNNGTFTAAPGSTVIFKGTGTQIISGSLTGTNKFGNLIVYKSTGTVVANTDIEIGGSFSTANGTSIFNSNQKYITLAGNFRNNNGNTTFTNTGTAGTLEFNGSGAQVYSQGASQLDLNKVVINNTAAAGSGVNLTGTIAATSVPVSTGGTAVPSQTGTDMFIKATTGTLTLTVGTISTGGAITTGSATITGNRVHVLNTAAASVSVGSTVSYVDGTLRRYHSTGAAGAFNWPMGKAASPGYQRALTNFTAISAAQYIDCRFSSWPSLPPFTTAYIECGANYNYDSENNGYWTFIPQSMTPTYTYDCTLYPLNATNVSGSAWTIIKRPHLTTIDNTGWVLNGTCVTSTATVVTRNAMTNFSFMGVDQAAVELPIELLYFKGHSEGSYNMLEWETVTERENDYFNLERSKDGINYEFMTQVDGAGNSLVDLYYTRNDYNPYNGITYYRLKQVDFNGSETYSNVVALTNKLDEISMSTLFPNPTTENTSFNFYTPTKGEMSVRVYDQTGRLVMDKVAKLHEGNSTVDLETKELATGIYNVEVKFDKGNFTMNDKLIKKY